MASETREKHTFLLYACSLLQYCHLVKKKNTSKISHPLRMVKILHYCFFPFFVLFFGFHSFIHSFNFITYLFHCIFFKTCFALIWHYSCTVYILPVTHSKLRVRERERACVFERARERESIEFFSFKHIVIFQHMQSCTMTQSVCVRERAGTTLTLSRPESCFMRHLIYQRFLTAAFSPTSL